MNVKSLKETIELLRSLLNMERTQENRADIKVVVNAIGEELSINLNDTINFFDTCSTDEFYWCSMQFVNLAKNFRSKELVACVERNIARIESKFTREELNFELEEMRKHV
ncbi:MAG: hypothetical protein K2M75_02925 [Clostridia bacterium]|nr:hypothetical protein [Clostridia bacterium]